MFGLDEIIPGIGDIFGAGGGEEARQGEYDKALDLYDNLPDYQYAGNVSSAYANEDPQLRDYQLNAIQSLQDLYKNGGVDASTTAALDKIRRDEDVNTRGSREAIMQDYRSRGLQGGDLLATLTNAQSSADRRNAGDTQAAGDAATRGLTALYNSGNLAGTTRGQDYERMSALDRIAEFNNQNRQNYYNNSYNNAYNVANQKSGIYTGVGNSKADQYNQQYGFGSTILGTAGSLIGGPAAGGAGYLGAKGAAGAGASGADPAMMFA